MHPPSPKGLRQLLHRDLHEVARVALDGFANFETFVSIPIDERTVPGAPNTTALLFAMNEELLLG
jgi:hypothetical protein